MKKRLAALVLALYLALGILPGTTRAVDVEDEDTPDLAGNIWESKAEMAEEEKENIPLISLEPIDEVGDPVLLTDTPASGACGDNLRWALDGSGTLTISGSGDMSNYSENSPAPWESVNYLISSIVFRGDISSIGDRAFYACYRLKGVTIPPSVTSIGERAFYASGLSGMLSIPESVEKIGTYAFSYTTLSEFRVASSNAAYCSEDGILYDKNKRTLYFYPTGKTSQTFIVPESVTLIYCTSFARATNLRDLYVYSPAVRAMTYTFYGDQLAIWCKPSVYLYSQVNEGKLSGTLSVNPLPYCSVEASSDKISVTLADQFTDGSYFLAAYSAQNKLVGVQAVNGVEAKTYAFAGINSVAKVRLFRLDHEFRPTKTIENIWPSD